MRLWVMAKVRVELGFISEYKRETNTERIYTLGYKRPYIVMKRVNIAEMMDLFTVVSVCSES